MTIIEPKKLKPKSKILILFLFGIVLVASLGVITFYNKIVDLKFQLSKQEQELEDLKVLNAELKNEVYSYLDVDNLSTIARALGLILDRNPTYLEMETPDLARNL